ncbi:hypothetical protein GW17_00024694 [Ensete ventricosum]|nr:hypothetical protein GW17_00024694 [Ensete ventricosum]
MAAIANSLVSVRDSRFQALSGGPLANGGKPNSASIFVGGFVLGGIVVGALACVYAPQISKALTETDKKDLMRRLPKFIYDEEKALEVSLDDYGINISAATVTAANCSDDSEEKQQQQGGEEQRLRRGQDVGGVIPDEKIRVEVYVAALVGLIERPKPGSVVALFYPGARPKRPAPGLGRAPRWHLFEARRLEIERGAWASPRLASPRPIA